MFFVVFGRPNCPYCDRAKMLLTERKVDFQYRDTVDGSEFNEMCNWVGEATGAMPRTVPQIFEITDGESRYIGGFDDLKFELTSDDKEEEIDYSFDL